MVGPVSFPITSPFLPFLFGGAQAPTDPLASLLGGTSSSSVPDPFTTLLLEEGSQESQILSLAQNAATSHSLQTAAQPLLPGPFSVFGSAQAPSPDQVDSAAQNLVTAINSALGAPNAGSSQALGAIAQFLKDQAAPLASIGITTDSTGQVTLDTSKLNQALSGQPAQVQELLGGPGGLAQNVTNNAQAFLGQTLGFQGAIPTNGLINSLLATTPGLLFNLLA